MMRERLLRPCVGGVHYGGSKGLPPVRMHRFKRLATGGRMHMPRAELTRRNYDTLDMGMSLCARRDRFGMLLSARSEVGSEVGLLVLPYRHRQLCTQLCLRGVRALRRVKESICCPCSMSTMTVWIKNVRCIANVINDVIWSGVSAQPTTLHRGVSTVTVHAWTVVR